MLAHQLSHDEIIRSVETAFLPLNCEARIWEFDSKLRFKISEGYGRPVVRMDEVDLRYAADKELLGSVLRKVRERMRDKGYFLH